MWRWVLLLLPVGHYVQGLRNYTYYETQKITTLKGDFLLFYQIDPTSRTDTS
jgi:hypothetical protein